MSILVLGLGNLLMTDDGLGVRAVQVLQADYRWPAQVRILDGGTLGLDLLPQLEGVERLLIIDALDLGREPGTLCRLEGEEVPRALASKLSVHQMGVQDLLAVAQLQGHLPEILVVYGAQPASIEVGLELTAPVAASFSPLLAQICGELHGWGVRLERAA